MEQVDLRAYFSTVDATEKLPHRSNCHYEYFNRKLKLDDTHPTKSIIELQLDQVLYLVEAIENVVRSSPEIFSNIIELKFLDEDVYAVMAGTLVKTELQQLVNSINSTAIDKSLTLRIFK